MIKVEAVKLIKPEPMLITWDTGRRCNYDCSYCEISRHDNASKFHSIDEYLKTFQFIKRWTNIYNDHRKERVSTNINFTGGEPTLNPALWDLADFIKNDSDNFNLSLTTNGAWNKKYTEKLLKRFSGVTVSYHTEGHNNLKQQVIENILELSKTNIRLQVNLMMHVDYWPECIEVFNLLKSNNISVKPRPIGDGNIERTGWFIDSDGSNRRTSHQYSPEQQAWFSTQADHNNSVYENKTEGSSLGRGCCGGRCLQGKLDNKWTEIKIIDTKFKDWSCMVDWFFLHIDQHTGLVYHHQTCQALHGNKRGALGHLQESESLLVDLESRMINKSAIICPNYRCGCGMCVPKAKDSDTFNELWNSLVR